jgi:hypothetical protein
LRRVTPTTAPRQFWALDHQAYNDDIPDNGRTVPDGTMMAKVEWSKKFNPALPVPRTYQTR